MYAATIRNHHHNKKGQYTFTQEKSAIGNQCPPRLLKIGKRGNPVPTARNAAPSAKKPQPANPRRARRFQIARTVAQHNRPRRIDSQPLNGLQNHPGIRLAPKAFSQVSLNLALRMLETGKRKINRNPLFPQPPQHPSR